MNNFGELLPSIIAIVFVLVIGIAVFMYGVKKHFITPIILFLIGYIAKPFIGNIDLVPLVLLSLIIVLFDIGSHFIPRGFDNISKRTLSFIFISIPVNIIVAFLVLHVFLFDTYSMTTILLSIIAGIMITASTQHDLIGMDKSSRKESIVLHIEDSLSNPVVMVLGIALITLLFEIKVNVTNQMSSILLNAAKSFALEAAIGIAFGMILMVTVVKIFGRDKVVLPSVGLAILTFVVTNYLGASGFISVLVMSMFFHNIISGRKEIEPYSSKISHMAYIIIFIFMGMAATMNSRIIITSVILLAVYILARFLISKFVFSSYSWKFSLDCQKGLAIAALSVYIMLILDKMTGTLTPNLASVMEVLIWTTVFSIIVSYAFKSFNKELI